MKNNIEIFLISLAIIFPINFAGAQTEESSPKVIKVSQKKFETAVVKALIQNKAEFHGIVSCENRCGGEAEEAADIDYDSKGLPYTYKVPVSKPGGLVAILTAEQEPIYLHKYFVLPLPSCREFLGKLREGRKPVSVGEEPYQLSVEYGLLSLGKNKFDLMGPLCENSPNYIGSGQNLSFEIQSIVGPIVNIVRHMHDASEGMSKATYGQDWISWNLEENRGAELTDLFEKESVMTALKNDKVMRQRFFKGRKAELERATELSPLMRAIEADPRQHKSRMGWQITAYDAKTGIANVHMGFYGDCCNNARIFKMGFKLKVKPELKNIVLKSQKNGWIGLTDDQESSRKKSKFERAFTTYVDLGIDTTKAR